MTPSRHRRWLLVAALGLLLAPGRGLAQADPCAPAGPLPVLELGGDESGIGGTGRSGDESGIGGTGRSGDESGIGGTGIAAHESGVGGTGVSGDPSGIGGTGVSGEESGIGGTGIYGTLTAFGSVCVNGLRVQYPEDVVVERNGQPDDSSVLALGQVLWVVAEGAPGDLSARKIAIHSAVLGEVSQLDLANRSLLVSGRRVSVPEGVYLGEGVRFDALSPGDRVDVSGLPSADGEIVATRIDAASPGQVDVSALPRAEALVVATAGLQWISVEGYVTGRPQRPQLGGIALDLSTIGGLPARVQPSARVRAWGRLLPDGAVRVERPVQRPDWPDRPPPPGSPPRPEIAPKPDRLPKPQVIPKPDLGASPVRPVVPRPPKRLERPTPPRPVRPEIHDIRPILKPHR